MVSKDYVVKSKSSNNDVEITIICEKPKFVDRDKWLDKVSQEMYLDIKDIIFEEVC